MTEWEKSSQKTRLLAQIDQLHALAGKLFATMLAALLLGLLWNNLARAASIPDIFMVPIVRLTPNGAAVMQPQTGDGYEALNSTRNTGSNTRSSLAQQVIEEAGQDAPVSGGSRYVPPSYDAFAEGSNSGEVYLPTPLIRNVENVAFSIRNNISGAVDQTMGTTATTFTFTADVSGNSLRQGDLQYRWDFDGDGKIDSYFSARKTITHRYLQAGNYQVRLEVLDAYGRVSTVARPLLVVNNDPPVAYFKASAVTAPQNSIIRFDTSLSSDSQYPRSQLQYRFDWDGDGLFDTNFEKKTTWNHLFREPGYYTVMMETSDPEGLTARAELDLAILDDSPPTARLNVERLGDFRYLFDASQSSDDYTPARLLQYRWDLDYSGDNDIVFDSSWTSSPKFSGSYRLGGSKTIRLQVKDQQGFIDESIAMIDLPWTEDYLNLAVGVTRR